MLHKYGNNNGDAFYLSEFLCDCEREAIVVSLENLATFPFIQERLLHGSLTLHGWYFDIEDGAMSIFDEQSQQFKQVD